MSEAQVDTFVILTESGDLQERNMRVLEAVKRMPQQQGTYQQVIDFIAGTNDVPIADGNAISAPIISALSELYYEGWLNGEIKIPNPRARKTYTKKGKLRKPKANTLYRWLGYKGPEVPKDESWKEYAERLEKELKLAKEETRLMEELATEAGRRYAEAMEAIKKLTSPATAD